MSNKYRQTPHNRADQLAVKDARLTEFGRLSPEEQFCAMSDRVRFLATGGLELGPDGVSQRVYEYEDPEGGVCYVEADINTMPLGSEAAIRTLDVSPSNEAAQTALRLRLHNPANPGHIVLDFNLLEGVVTEYDFDKGGTLVGVEPVDNTEVFRALQGLSSPSHAKALLMQILMSKLANRENLSHWRGLMYDRVISAYASGLYSPDDSEGFVARMRSHMQN